MIAHSGISCPAKGSFGQEHRLGSPGTLRKLAPTLHLGSVKSLAQRCRRLFKRILLRKRRAKAKST